MKALRVCAWVLALSIIPARVSADWHFTPFAGATFSGSTTIVDLESGAEKTRTHYGIAASRIGKYPLGVEALFVYVPGFFEGDDTNPIEEPDVLPPRVLSSRVFALMGNVIFATPREWNEYGLRPFVSGGLGWLHASQRDNYGVYPITRNILGWNVGGGAIGFLSPSTGVRFDARYFSNLQPASASGDVVGDREHLSFWTASIGIVIRY